MLQIAPETPRHAQRFPVTMNQKGRGVIAGSKMCMTDIQNISGQPVNAIDYRHRRKKK